MNENPEQEKVNLSLVELGERADDAGHLKVPFEKVFSILVEAFINLATDEQACLKAGIAPSTYYKWINESEDFKVEMMRAKHDTKIKAKYNIKKAIDSGDVDNSKWYIERAEKQDFSPRTETTGANGEPINKIKVEFIDGTEPQGDQRTEENDPS